MRKTILLAGAIVAYGNSTSAAIPYFSNSQPAQQTAPAKAETGGWKWPRLWGTSDETDSEPHFFYQSNEPQPSVTERLGAAIGAGRAITTARGWISAEGSSSGSAKEQPDSISLGQPVGDPTPALMISMAQMREVQGDIPGARKLYQQALAAGPRQVKTLRAIGHFEDRQGQLQDAERYYAQAQQVAPEDAAALNDLALCLARQGKLDQAAEALSRAVKIAPQKPLYRNNLATVLMETGEQHEAMKHLMAVHSPANAFYNMGHLLEKGHQLEAAAAHYAEAQRLDPKLDAAQSALARVHGVDHASVPQTAMAPKSFSAEPQQTAESDTHEWPSEPISVPTNSASSTNEPEFGPRLLPPVE